LKELFKSSEPQIYRRWEKAGRDPEWCRRKGLQARSLKFAADVRRQLAAAVSKEADVRNGSQDVRNESQEGLRKKDRSTEQRTVPLRKALCIGFANKLARRMTKHNGYRTMGEKSQLVQVRDLQGGWLALFRGLERFQVKPRGVG
jgi:ATP-dependent RNA helicase DHX8/PRP22